MRKLGMTLLIIASMALLAACSRESIIGSWQHDEANVIYTFNEDNAFTLDIGQGQAQRSGTWTEEEDGILVLSHENGTSQRSEYKIDGKQLIFTSPDSGSVSNMTRIKKQD